MGTENREDQSLGLVKFLREQEFGSQRGRRGRENWGLRTGDSVRPMEPSLLFEGDREIVEDESSPTGSSFTSRKVIDPGSGPFLAPTS